MSSRREDVLDSVVVVLLLALTLSILDDTFADRGYLVTGLVPAVLLLALAVLARRFHEGVWWYALCAVLLFAPLGGLVALRRPGPLVLPTLETMNRVLGECLSAPTTLVSTVPPVEASGQVMLVPFMIGFLVAAPAAWLAVATRSVLGPAVPLVLGLGATIPVGVLVPTYLVPRGIAIAIVLIAWAAVRARRREALAGATRGSFAAAATALATVAMMSVLASFLVPDNIEVDRVLLRGEGNARDVASAADSVLPSAGPGNQLLKTTGVPDGRRIRFAALDLYDGSAWVPADTSPGTDGFGTFKRIGREVATLHDGRTTGIRVQVRPGYSSDWLPMLGELASLDLDYTDGRTQISQVRYNQATSSALVVGGVDPRDDYTMGVVLTPDTFTRRDPTREATEEQRQPEGAFLDPYLRPFDRAELRPVERVLLLARYLRLNGSQRITGSSSQAPVDLGLRLLGARAMVGTQFQYSAVMALGASRLGVPARVVTGAEPGARGIVLRDDVTSWVELQFADGTWRTLDPARYVGVHVLTEDEDPFGGVGAGGFVKEQLQNAAKGKDKEIRIPKGTPITFPDGTVLDAVDESLSPWQVLLLVIGVLLAAIVVVLLLVPLAKVVRRARRRRTSSWSGLYVNGWQEVVDVARDRGTPVPEGWSRVAQASALGAGVGLARRADAVVFAPGPGADASDGRAFWDDCLALRRQLLQDTDVRHRWWAVFNPASLLAGWARGRRDDSGVAHVRHEDRRAGGQQPARA